MRQTVFAHLRLRLVVENLVNLRHELRRELGDNLDSLDILADLLGLKEGQVKHS